MNRREYLEEKGYKPELVKSNVRDLIGLFLLCFIPFLGAFWWFYISMRNIFKFKTKYYIYEEEPIYKIDRRYKSNYKIIGYREVKEYSEYLLKPSKKERIIYITKGIFSLSLSISSFIVWHDALYKC